MTAEILSLFIDVISWYIRRSIQLKSTILSTFSLIIIQGEYSFFLTDENILSNELYIFCIVTGAGLALIFLYEYFMARTDLLERLSRVPLPLRWAIYYLVIFAILAYGKFGMEEFIYLQF